MKAGGATPRLELCAAVRRMGLSFSNWLGFFISESLQYTLGGWLMESEDCCTSPTLLS
jgi:hypothetical protein